MLIPTSHPTQYLYKIGEKLTLKRDEKNKQTNIEYFFIFRTLVKFKLKLKKK